MEEIVSPTVFISYAHDTVAHEERVLELSDKLLSRYINSNCDQYVEDGNPERGWPNWMEENIRVSDFVLVVASERFLERFEGRAKAGTGLGAKWESTLTANEIYQNDSVNKKYIPVVFDSADKKFIPTFLQPFTYYNLSTEDDFALLLKRLKGELKNRKPKMGTPHLVKKSDIGSLLEKKTTTEGNSNTLPEIPQFTNDMKPGMKILQAFFVLPISNRFKIASDLNLVEIGETIEANNVDEISGRFLIRAKERNMLADLWSKLFDENIDPNPFKS
ncbi:SEFIR domain-containing protein [Pedobacter frigidisoli]|uniref:SEFIR domain-containing protein n=1 Tax=Pedobacter frigidisoli TaxID=2530455 RepID=UPI002930C2E4|nr:SEFIR domain-containing protein [Pedobacter frigidisoli]